MKKISGKFEVSDGKIKKDDQAAIFWKIFFTEIPECPRGVPGPGHHGAAAGARAPYPFAKLAECQKCAFVPPVLKAWPPRGRPRRPESANLAEYTGMRPRRPLQILPETVFFRSASPACATSGKGITRSISAVGTPFIAFSRLKLSVLPISKSKRGL